MKHGTENLPSMRRTAVAILRVAALKSLILLMLLVSKRNVV